MAAIPESPSDAQLVRDALADQDAFTHIITRYERPLRRYMIRLGMPDPEHVSDLLQEIFIKAYTHLNDYDSTLSLRAWLYRIARNAVIDDMRRQSHRPHAFAREEDTAIFERVADDLDIEQEAYARDDGRAVREAVRALDVRYRDAIVLRFFEEKSYREMSDIMQMPEGTVAAYIFVLNANSVQPSSGIMSQPDLMQNEHETFPESVLSEIRDRGIAPIPRWQFLASRTFAWVLAGLSVAVGGVAFSIAEFVFFDNDGPARLHGSSLEDIAQSIPFVWLAFVGFFALVAYYGFRQTRHGYRYATAWVVGIVVASSVAFGLILNAVDLGQAVYQALPGLAAQSVDGSD